MHPLGSKPQKVAGVLPDEMVMAMPAQNESAGLPSKQWFATTHWSVVLGAADTSAPGSQEALEGLCRAYWFPLYAYVRRQGHSPEDSEDLTQAFFARFLEKKYFQKADPERGRFRSFLLTSLRNFLVNEWERSKTEKRGGTARPLPLDTVAAEHQYNQALAHNMTAEKVYERNWALTLLGQVRDRLRQEYGGDGKSVSFEQLDQFLPGQKGELTYAEAAQQLGIPEGTLKAAVSRLKKRFRELLRLEIAHTVTDEAEVNEELRHLIAVLVDGGNSNLA
jgi:RNA polymerase sigma-70 factor (ECF subfamily)